MRRAAAYYVESVALHGGYVYYYSLDLQQRLGEGKAGDTQIWVQPPGTPTVGLALLRAYEATGDRYYLEAATRAAEALIYGQLASGGWTNCVDFDARGARVAQYRNGRGRGKNNSTLDDGISQAAMELLIRTDQAHRFQNEAIHSAARIALDALLAAQFPNGGFPQVWSGPVSRQEVVVANYPEYDWRSEGRIKNYWDMYTLNDGVAGNVARVLIVADQVYGDSRYRQALVRLGDFLLLAQMPDPQPAWAQQYNYDMQPIWARRFEPAAIASRESEDAIRTLLTIHEATGDGKYLAPIPRALEYLSRSLLPDGRLARYYELKSNRPLYMSRRGDAYTLTYDDSDLPDHYGWKITPTLQDLEERYKSLRDGQPHDGQQPPSEADVRRLIESLDEQGRWISRYQGEALVGQPEFRPNEPYLSSAVFSENLEKLAALLAATPEVVFHIGEDRLQITVGSQPFAEYVFADEQVRRPYFRHLRTPAGVQVTRNHPPRPGDHQDHATMHPGLWLAFGELGGHDFWRNKGEVRHVRILSPPQADASGGRFAVRNSYESGGRVVCTEDCRITVLPVAQGTLLLWNSVFRAVDASVAFGDQEEMGLGVRVATSLAVENGGRIRDAAGRENGSEVWGTQSAWCVYSGMVDDQPVGVALFPHPENFRPSWFHARDYGLLVANPFGQKAFTGGPPSRVIVEQNRPLQLRFAVLVLDGRPDIELVASDLWDTD